MKLLTTLLLGLICTQVWAQKTSPPATGQAVAKQTISSRSKGQRISAKYLVFNSNDSAYDTTYLISYIDDRYDRLALEIRTNFTDKTYAGKTSYTYDAAGHLTVTQGGDDSISGNWHKDSSAYDTHGNLVYHASFYRPGGQWTMTQGDRYTYTYDGQGHVTERIQELYNGSNWQNGEKTDYTLDANGNVTGASQYYYFSNTWQPEYKMLDYNLYQGDINKPLSYIRQTPDGNGGWENESRHTYTYTSSGQPLSSLTEQPDNGSWTSSLRETYHYDTKGNLTLYTMEGFNGNTWSLIDGTADSIRYDANGNILSEENMHFTGFTNRWQKVDMYIYQYNEMSGIQETAAWGAAVSVYPNPVQGELHIVLPAGTKGSMILSVYDLQGRLVYHVQQSGAPTMTMPVDLLAKGMYNLRVENDGQVSSKLIVKE